MSDIEIERGAIALPERERINLLEKLLESLKIEEYDVPDEEVAHREHELETGAVQEISHDELVRNVQQRRGR